MEFLDSWWAFMSTRVDQIQVALAEHSVYVVTVLGLASFFSVGLGILTRRNVLARELSLAVT